MDFYISKDNVIQSINYFKGLEVNSDDNLFLYLLSKHIGISTTYPVTYLTSNLTEEQKREYLKAIWMLAGMFDSGEVGKKRSLIFPNSFKSVEYYQPGTEYSKVISRIKDTLEKKNLNVPLYEDKSSYLKLRRNYQEVIAENYLEGSKISLSHLTAWIFRFTKFEFDKEPTSKEFSKVLEKAIIKFLRINKKDFVWLFEKDLSFNRLEPATNGITGTQIRGEFEFRENKQPEIERNTTDSYYQESSFSKEITRQYLELNGDNPSNKEILDTLLNKKQIVLTGVPGVGKSRYANWLANRDDFGYTELIQFHANYSYEDFICSETLTSDGNATIVATRKGVFLEYIEKAKSDPTKNYLFIIDELNRGNIAEIFGETILTLDRDYSVRLTKNVEGIDLFNIPKNLYIVGTMNTSDRNIAFLDLAIRRRFAFINLLPNYDFLSEKVILENIDLGNVLKIINQRILDTLGDSELLLGHSYFIPNKSEKGYVWSIEDFKNQFNFVLLPTLKEYSFNNPNILNTIVGDSLSDTIQDVDEFFRAFRSEFSIGEFNEKVCR